MAAWYAEVLDPERRLNSPPIRPAWLRVHASSAHIGRAEISVLGAVCSHVECVVGPLAQGASRRRQMRVRVRVRMCGAVRQQCRHTDPRMQVLTHTRG
jgi:hypothetical protein